MTHRPEKLGDIIRDALSRILREEARDPRIGFVTITRVKVSPDLSEARVYVSRLGSAAERMDSVRALERAAPFLRRALAHEAAFRRVPHLAFLEDATAEEGARMEDLLEKMRREREERPDDAEARKDEA